jgi:hypothetical protein
MQFNTIQGKLAQKKKDIIKLQKYEDEQKEKQIEAQKQAERF